jgi:cell division protein FtsL
MSEKVTNSKNVPEPRQKTVSKEEDLKEKYKSTTEELKRIQKEFYIFATAILILMAIAVIFVLTNV